jgi:hypothetical protein
MAGGIVFHPQRRRDHLRDHILDRVRQQRRLEGGDIVMAEAANQEKPALRASSGVIGYQR